MAIAPTPGRALAQDEPRFLTEDVDWLTSKTLLHALGSHHVRMTYDRRSLELRSPSSQHEAWKKPTARRLDEFRRFLRLAEATNETAWVRCFRAWVQDKPGAHRRPEEGAAG